MAEGRGRGGDGRSAVPRRGGDGPDRRWRRRAREAGTLGGGGGGIEASAGAPGDGRQR